MRQAGIELDEFGRPIQGDNENENEGNEGNEAVNDIVNRLMHGNHNWRGGRKKTNRKYIRKLKHKTYKLRKKK